MDTFLKLTSTKKDLNCNCISPFYINSITGVNPITGNDYTPDDVDKIKTSLYRISNAKGCQVGVCCDPKDPFSTIDQDYMNSFIKKYPKIQPVYDGSTLKSISLSTSTNVNTSGWIDPTPYFVCKITKAKISPTDKPTIFKADNLVSDCFTDQCNSAEQITLNNLVSGAKREMLQSTSFDDQNAAEAIRRGDINYVKEFIRKYKQVDAPLMHDGYNNRLIHIASENGKETSSDDILYMLISLKANINIKNKYNETPLHYAVRANKMENANKLISQGADLTISTAKGETPMFYAVKQANMGMIRLLYAGGSTVLNLDKDGNNLIHYCILYAKSGDTVSDDAKADIIRFLLDSGVSSEQKNKNGKTPLELTQGRINRELNKECTSGNTPFDDTVKEAFFNVKTDKNNREGFTSGNEVSSYTPDHISLLQIQTMLFNNILRNNPDKYSKYVSVNDIPKGSPIEILDTVCVGEGLTGNEDSYECVEKGGQLVKVLNKTTKIKLELIPEEQSAIDNIPQKDLYFDKSDKPTPTQTLPSNIARFNQSVMGQSSSVPQTTGMMYSVGDNSSNQVLLPTVPNKPIVKDSSPSSAQPPSASIPSGKSPKVTFSMPPEHPPFIDENDEEVKKCKKEAILNSTKLINNTTHTTLANIILPTFTQSVSSTFSFGDYWWLFVIIILIIVIIGGAFLYKKYKSQ